MLTDSKNEGWDLFTVKGKTPFFCGYYGQGNLGDDALLLSILYSLADHCPALSPLCLSGGDPAFDGALKKRGVRIVERAPRAVFSAIRACDVVVFGGGSLLQNATGNASLYAYLSLLALARIYGKETAILSGGLGPITGRLPRRATAFFLRRLDYASFRDVDACMLAEALGARDVRLSGDPALLLPPEEYTSPLPDRFLLVTLREKSGITARDAADIIRSEAEGRLITPILCPLFPREDGAYLRAVCSRVSTWNKDTRMLPALSLGALRAVTARASYVLSGRYHLALLAFGSGVPFSVLGDDPKLSAIKEERRSPDEVAQRAREDMKLFAEAFL